MDGVPPGAVEAVVAILRRAGVPMRRREILAELERRGHRISLAGLNRVLERCAQEGRTVVTPDGIRAGPGLTPE